jgi:glycosyltransferase involved in cell wall biosynthesis
MPKIAVITRTKDRPYFLKRCAQSIAGQSYKDLLWVIVNDGGETGAVEAVAADAGSRGVAVKVVHREQSHGVWPPANHGIRESDSALLHLHDDDDSLHPEFYAKAVEFLDGRAHYKGVVTHSVRIDEALSGAVIAEVRRYPYNPRLDSIYVADLLVRNLFPPISFVYSREVHDKVGLYDEGLPVIGDWDFNLRFIERFDIGVLPSQLANWHWRVRNDGGAASSNTMTAGADKHKEYTTLLRNRMLRRDLEAQRLGLGVLITLARYQSIQENAIKPVSEWVERKTVIRRLVRKFLDR